MIFACREICRLSGSKFEFQKSNDIILKRQPRRSHRCTYLVSVTTLGHVMVLKSHFRTKKWSVFKPGKFGALKSVYCAQDPRSGAVIEIRFQNRKFMCHYMP